MTATRDLIAVDIGNSRLKAGRFLQLAEQPALPEPVETLSLPIDNKTGEFDVDRFHTWCDQQHTAHQASVLVASVHRGAAARLANAVSDWIRYLSGDIAMRSLSYRDVPLMIRLDEPARVGIDRLLAALVANRLRRREKPAIIVSLGTAITVDLLEADGAFAGGAILPGIAMSARALAADTDALPLVDPERLKVPPRPLGKSTTAAIESGLFWGAIGAIRELILQLSSALPTSPELFLTGGASWQVADQLTMVAENPVHHVPHLVLAGIAVVDAEAAGKAGG